MTIRRKIVFSGFLGMICGGVGWLVFTSFLLEHPAAEFAPQQPLLWIGLFGFLFAVSRAIDEKLGLTTW